MLNNTQLLALLQLPNLGRKSIIAMAEYALLTKKNVGSIAEFHEFVTECKSRKIIRGGTSYLETEINTAYAFALSIEEASENADIQITSFFDKNYPERLRHLKKDGKTDSPVLLLILGEFNLVIYI